jgi:hypothetical protein
MSEFGINPEPNIPPVWPATKSEETNNRKKEKPIIRKNKSLKTAEQDQNTIVDENGHIDIYV